VIVSGADSGLADFCRLLCYRSLSISGGFVGLMVEFWDGFQKRAGEWGWTRAAGNSSFPWKFFKIQHRVLIFFAASQFSIRFFLKI
jgi:hypothetical protein